MQLAKDIPNYELTDQARPVDFVIRKMEGIWDESQGRPDQPHRHDYYTVVWAIRAKGTHRIDFQDYPLSDHAVFFVSPDQVHQVILEERPVGLAILFTSGFLQLQGIDPTFISRLNLFNNCDETPPIRIPEERMADFQLLQSQLVAAYESPSDGWKRDELGTLLRLLLIRCNRLAEAAPAALAQERGSGHTLIQAFKQAVEQHFRTHHKVSDYAEMLFVTANHLNDVVKSKIGRSAKTYIQHRLALEAKRQAIFTQLTGKEIGFELGFDDPGHFSKFFKKHAGMSFQEFRETEHGVLRHTAG